MVVEANKVVYAKFAHTTQKIVKGAAHNET